MQNIEIIHFELDDHEITYAEKPEWHLELTAHEKDGEFFGITIEWKIELYSTNSKIALACIAETKCYFPVKLANVEQVNDLVKDSCKSLKIELKDRGVTLDLDCNKFQPFVARFLDTL